MDSSLTAFVCACVCVAHVCVGAAERERDKERETVWDVGYEEHMPYLWCAA